MGSGCKEALGSLHNDAVMRIQLLEGLGASLDQAIAKVEDLVPRMEASGLVSERDVAALERALVKMREVGLRIDERRNELGHWAVELERMMAGGEG